ncbi:MAG: macro domain-containing protein [Burkholderiales bacterium]
MIKFASGNLLQASAQALVNTVNTEGVMGKGIALQFKKAYPRMYEEYAAACKAGLVRLGEVDVFDLGGLGGGPRWIINFPTKGHWKAKSRLADIDSGLASLIDTVERLEISSIAVPPLGCGNGGLDWNEVCPRIESAFRAVPSVEVLLFAPAPAPEASAMPNATMRPQLSTARAALVELIRRYEAALLGAVVSLLEVHKLMYFLQEAGESLRLQYKAHTYGPYALNLRHLMSTLDGHYLSGFGDGADRPDKVIDLLEGAAGEAQEYLKSRPAVLERLERVSELIVGFEDPYGMELLSSMHWVMCHVTGARDSADIAIAAVREWNPGKRLRLKPEHLKVAWTRLKEKRWDTESRSALH